MVHEEMDKYGLVLPISMGVRSRIRKCDSLEYTNNLKYTHHHLFVGVQPICTIQNQITVVVKQN